MAEKNEPFRRRDRLYTSDSKAGPRSEIIKIFVMAVEP